MSTYLEIDFLTPHHLGQSEGKEGRIPFSLRWEINNKSYSTIWLKTLLTTLKGGTPASFRFSGFENSPKDFKFLSERLNEAIEIINADGIYPKITERADGSFNQEFANTIHHHFELLIGDSKSPSSFYKNSSPMGKGAISVLNHCIHDMEALSRAQAYSESSRSVVLEFLQRSQYRIPKEMYSDFTFDLGFGDICLHYGLVGKTWWEVFLDKDEEIFPEAIRPLDVIGPEFDIQFHHFKMSEELKKEFNHFLRSHHQDPQNPLLGLGFLRVGKLLTSLSPQEVREAVGKESGVSALRVLEDEKILFEEDFSNKVTANNGYFKVYRVNDLLDHSSLETQAYPIQTFIIRAIKEGTTLNKTLFTGDYLKDGHTISLIVPIDGKSIKLLASNQFRGMDTSTDQIILPGESLHLAYDTVNGYTVIDRSALKSN